MPLSYIPARHRYRADPLAAVEQITAAARTAVPARVDAATADQRWAALQAQHQQRLQDIEAKAQPAADGTFGTGHLCRRLRELCPPNTIWAVEAVTNKLASTSVACAVSCFLHTNSLRSRLQTCIRGGCASH